MFTIPPPAAPPAPVFWLPLVVLLLLFPTPLFKSNGLVAPATEKLKICGSAHISIEKDAVLLSLSYGSSVRGRVKLPTRSPPSLLPFDAEVTADAAEVESACALLKRSGQVIVCSDTGCDDAEEDADRFLLNGEEEEEVAIADATRELLVVLKPTERSSRTFRSRTINEVSEEKEEESTNGEKEEKEEDASTLFLELLLRLSPPPPTKVESEEEEELGNNGMLFVSHTAGRSFPPELAMWW